MSKEDFRIRIVEEAAQVFNRYGYKKTTMDEIAEQLGKGKSSIYYYFKSKEEIFKAVVEKEALLLRTKVRKSIELSNDPKEQIKRYVLTRTEAYKYIENFNNALKDDVLLHLDFVKELRDRYDQYEIELVKKILIGGVETGEFKLNSINISAVGIVTALKGLQELFLKINNQEEMNRRLDNLLSILFYGIIKQ